MNDELRLIVIDAATGDSLWDQSMTQSDAVGSGIAVEYYPGDDVPLSGGIPAPVTFPVADGTALSGDNAHVYTDVNDDDAADPKDEVAAISGLDFSYAPLIDTDQRRPELLHALLLHVGQDRAEGLEAQPQVLRGAALPLPQHLPRSPRWRRRSGSRRRPGTSRSTTRAAWAWAATPCRVRPSMARTSTTGSPTGPRQQREHVDLRGRCAAA